MSQLHYLVEDFWLWFFQFQCFNRVYQNQTCSWLGLISQLLNWSKVFVTLSKFIEVTLVPSIIRICKIPKNFILAENFVTITCIFNFPKWQKQSKIEIFSKNTKISWLFYLEIYELQKSAKKISSYYKKTFISFYIVLLCIRKFILFWQLLCSLKTFYYWI